MLGVRQAEQHLSIELADLQLLDGHLLGQISAGIVHQRIVDPIVGHRAEDDVVIMDEIAVAVGQNELQPILCRPFEYEDPEIVGFLVFVFGDRGATSPAPLTHGLGPIRRLLSGLSGVESLPEIHRASGLENPRRPYGLIAAVVQAHALRIPVPEHLSYLRNLEPPPTRLLFLLPMGPSVPSGSSSSNPTTGASMYRDGTSPSAISSIG